MCCYLNLCLSILLPNVTPCLCVPYVCLQTPISIAQSRRLSVPCPPTSCVPVHIPTYVACVTPFLAFSLCLQPVAYCTCLDTLDVAIRHGTQPYQHLDTFQYCLILCVAGLSRLLGCVPCTVVPNIRLVGAVPCPFQGFGVCCTYCTAEGVCADIRRYYAKRG